ncbi:hypothetical protein [Roseospira navarrensis]|uniref:Uncharacterized protein n=1 Tax=Roseospira navarrensis TaxID=140058 RepID=A0A7X2D496_9PROT|nr:hypothetical protein [Roseospira navarrensis]MQX35965.1 hypothetical protein [Roseospira navarrensis]
MPVAPWSVGHGTPARAALLTLGLAVAACAPQPTYGPRPDAGRGAGPAGVIQDTTRAAMDSGLTAGPTDSRPGPAGPAAGACGRLLATRDHVARLRDLIAAIEADGVTESERTDLMRASSRLHGAESDLAEARRDVAGARFRLEALTGGRVRAGDLPACE